MSRTHSIYELAQQRADPEYWDADDIWWAPDFGVLVKRGRKWWASNDIRWQDVGVRPNDQLAQPTLGPFASRRAAADAYDAADDERSRLSERKVAIILGWQRFARRSYRGFGMPRRVA